MVPGLRSFLQDLRSRVPPMTWVPGLASQVQPVALSQAAGPTIRWVPGLWSYVLPKVQGQYANKRAQKFNRVELGSVREWCWCRIVLFWILLF